MAPFTLAPAQDKWTLKLGASSSALSAAVAWPSVQNTLAPAEAWRSRHDLALAALSLPGLVLGATADTAADSVDRLPVQYRHDLPYTDELNTLARLPARPRPGTPNNQEAGAESLAEDVPLTPETFAAYWDQLSRRASLAALDAVDALAGSPGAQQVRYLVEPYIWPAQAQADLAAYPGKLTLAQNGEKLELEAETALQGISGAFNANSGQLDLVPDNTDGGYRIEAGSMAAHLNAAGGVESEGMRDHAG